MTSCPEKVSRSDPQPGSIISSLECVRYVVHVGIAVEAASPEKFQAEQTFGWLLDGC